jgi:hypothetical protein
MGAVECLYTGGKERAVSPLSRGVNPLSMCPFTQSWAVSYLGFTGVESLVANPD